MAHCKKARAFLQCSSGAVYEPVANEAFKETDPLGDSHRRMLPTYSICKIASESMARFGARQWNLPTVIPRLSVPYGANGGWPSMHLEMMLAGKTSPWVRVRGTCTIPSTRTTSLLIFLACLKLQMFLP